MSQTSFMPKASQGCCCCTSDCVTVWITSHAASRLAASYMDGLHNESGRLLWRRNWKLIFYWILAQAQSQHIGWIVWVNFCFVSLLYVFNQSACRSSSWRTWGSFSRSSWLFLSSCLTTWWLNSYRLPCLSFVVKSWTNLHQVLMCSFFL